jgi:hypothetical protein
LRLICDTVRCPHGTLLGNSARCSMRMRSHGWHLST